MRIRRNISVLLLREKMTPRTPAHSRRTAICPKPRAWELGSPTGLTTRITATMTRENTSRLWGRETQLRNAHDGSRPTIRRARPTSFARACARPARRRGSLLKKLRQRHRGLDIRHRWLRPQPPMAALMAWLYRLAAAGVDVRFADLP